MIQPDDTISVIRSVSGTWHMDQPDADVQGKAITQYGRLIKFKLPEKYRIEILASDELPSYKACCECPWPDMQEYYFHYYAILENLGRDKDERAPMDSETHLKFRQLLDDMTVAHNAKWRKYG